MPKFDPTTMIGVVVGLNRLGALGLLTNPKAERASSGAGDVTRESWRENYANGQSIDQLWAGALRVWFADLADRV